MGKSFYKHSYKGKYKFLKNWFDDREGKEFERKIDDWLIQFDKDEQSFLLECLNHYSYFRAAEYNYAITKLYEDFNNEHINWQEKSKIFMIHKEGGKVSNSDEFFVNFWKINNIKSFCNTNIEEFIEDIDLFDQLIFIDDYIGTGNTIVQYIYNLIEKYPIIRTKPIYILTLFLTRSGELALNNFAADNRLYIKLYYYKTGDKYFKEGYCYKLDELLQRIELYDVLWNKKYNDNNFKYGYKDIQSLFSVNNDTPNDTLGIFWKKTSYYNPLFNRNFEEKGKNTLEEMIKKRKNKDVLKKEQLWKDPIDSIVNLLFVGYCARKKNVFDFEDACERFDLTKEQLEIKINYVIDKGYIKIENRRFVETEKFWESIKKRKYNKYFTDYINGNIEEKTLDFKLTNYLPQDFEKRIKDYK